MVSNPTLIRRIYTWDRPKNRDKTIATQVESYLRVQHVGRDHRLESRWDHAARQGEGHLCAFSFFLLDMVTKACPKTLTS